MDYKLNGEMNTEISQFQYSNFLQSILKIERNNEILPVNFFYRSKKKFSKKVFLSLLIFELLGKKFYDNVDLLRSSAALFKYKCIQLKIRHFGIFFEYGCNADSKVPFAIFASNEDLQISVKKCLQQTTYFFENVSWMKCQRNLINLLKKHDQRNIKKSKFQIQVYYFNNEDNKFSDILFILNRNPKCIIYIYLFRY